LYFNINCLDDGGPLAAKNICWLMIMIQIIVLSNISDWDKNLRKKEYLPHRNY
jgi:hypothetical protein